MGEEYLMESTVSDRNRGLRVRVKIYLRRDPVSEKINISHNIRRLTTNKLLYDPSSCP